MFLITHCWAVICIISVFDGMGKEEIVNTEGRKDPGIKISNIVCRLQ